MKTPQERLKEMKDELRKDILQILLFTSIIWLIGLFAILSFGRKLGILSGLIVWLITLLVIRNKK